MKTALARMVIACALLAAGGSAALAQQQQTQQKGPGALGPLGPPMKASALAKARGGAKAVIGKMEVDAKLHDNRAVDTISGNNVISDSAFSNASGLPVAIQNSGNNVIIQNSFLLQMDVQ
jgi:hypothetical protein